MTAEPSTPIPRTRSRWRIIRRVLLLALLAACAWLGWREYTFRAAIKQAQALGWLWEYEDPLDAIRADWKAAFRKATWIDGKRNLVIWAETEFERHVHVVRRLDPKSLYLPGRPDLKDLSALEGLSSLQDLELDGCTALTDVDALKGLPALRWLDLRDCTGLPAEAIAALKAAMPNTEIATTPP